MTGLRRALCVAVAACALIGAADARAGAVSCGDVVITDVVLERSLVGCHARLVARGYAGITVIDGAIRGFPQGISISEGSDARIEQVVVAGASLTGIAVDAPGSRVMRNAVLNSGTGFLLSGEARPTAAGTVRGRTATPASA